jgi:hypothetical protein
MDGRARKTFVRHGNRLGERAAVNPKHRRRLGIYGFTRVNLMRGSTGRDFGRLLVIPHSA